MEMTSAFDLKERLDNIAVITIDVPGEKMNTLKAEFGVQVRAILKQIRENKGLRGVVLISAKPDNFIAGADINMIGECKTAQEAGALQDVVRVKNSSSGLVIRARIIAPGTVEPVDLPVAAPR